MIAEAVLFILRDADVNGRVPKTRKERVAVDERNASRPRWKTDHPRLVVRK